MKGANARGLTVAAGAGSSSGTRESWTKRASKGARSNAPIKEYWRPLLQKLLFCGAPFEGARGAIEASYASDFFAFLAGAGAALPAAGAAGAGVAAAAAGAVSLLAAVL